MNVRLLAAISFHYNEERLGFLYDIVRELCLFPCETDIFIYTNATNHTLFDDLRLSFPADIKLIRDLDLAHPYHLTWCHKHLIRSHFIDKDYGYSHFLYLEDDERFSFGNLQFFLRYRKALSEYGLIPGFLRTEWCRRRNSYVSTDNITAQNVSRRPHISIEGISFTVLDNPYAGMYLLDRELIVEYTRTDSFDIKKSANVTSWEVRERAAMGLMFEKIPRPFEARCAVGVNGLAVLPEATIRHLPNNYADDASSMFGKVLMSDLLIGKFDASCVVKKRQSAWLRSRLWSRLSY